MQLLYVMIEGSTEHLPSYHAIVSGIYPQKVLLFHLPVCTCCYNIIIELKKKRFILS